MFSWGACPKPLHFSAPQDQVMLLWDVPPSLRIRECGQGRRGSSAFLIKLPYSSGDPWPPLNTKVICMDKVHSVHLCQLSNQRSWFSLLALLYLQTERDSRLFSTVVTRSFLVPNLEMLKKYYDFKIISCKESRIQCVKQALERTNGWMRWQAHSLHFTGRKRSRGNLAEVLRPRLEPVFLPETSRDFLKSCDKTS